MPPGFQVEGYAGMTVKRKNNNHNNNNIIATFTSIRCVNLTGTHVSYLFPRRSPLSPVLVKFDYSYCVWVLVIDSRFEHADHGDTVCTSLFCCELMK